MPKIVYHDITPDELEELGETLIKVGGQLRGAGAAMRVAGLESTRVTHESQKKDGLRFLRNFTTAVYQNLMGEIDLTPPPPPSPKSGAKKQR